MHNLTCQETTPDKYHTDGDGGEFDDFGLLTYSKVTLPEDCSQDCDDCQEKPNCKKIP